MWRSGPSKQGLARGSPLVTPSSLRSLFFQLHQRLASMSPLVTHAFGERSPGWPPATPAPAPHAPGRRSSPGSAVWTASAPGSPPCSPCGNRAPSSNAGAADCAGPGETTAHSSNTCVVFASSSIGFLRPPMMRPSAPERDAESQWAEENEEPFSGSFSKKTPPKKTTISDWQNDYTFRLVVAPAPVVHRRDAPGGGRVGAGAGRADPDRASGRTGRSISVEHGRVSFRLEDGRTMGLDRNDSALRHLDHAWASTVHAFQGRTVDNVIAAMEASHPHLTTQKSFYVEISRARNKANL